MRTVVDTYCVNCHDADAPKGRLNLASVDAEDIGSHPEVWEKVVSRLGKREMPPAGKKRPSEDAYASTLAQLETALDRAAAERPNPGRTDTIRRRTYPQGLVIVQTGHEPMSSPATLPIKSSSGTSVQITSDTYVDWPDGFVIWFLSQ